MPAAGRVWSESGGSRGEPAGPASSRVPTPQPSLRPGAQTIRKRGARSTVTIPAHGSGRDFYVGLLEALVQAMGASNEYLLRHGPRVGLLAERIGRSLGLDRRRLARVFFGGVLMDLGMIGLVEDAWEDPVTVLPPNVRSRLEEHPQRSAATVAVVPYLEDVAPLVRAHHEWWDGSGYPLGLRGEEIPVGARILRLADTVCALGEERPYRATRDADVIRREVCRGAGSEFSPRVAGAFMSLAARSDDTAAPLDAFRPALLRAAGDLLPPSISDVSTDRLLKIFGSLIDAKDPYTGGHSRRVAALSRAVAERLGLDEEAQQTARAAGYLHDLGKLTVPVRILTKRGRLAPAERSEVHKHPVTGARILRSIPSLRHLTDACRHHHERWDGRGYPAGLAGHRIPLLAQILGVCDAYDAMTSGRAYRPRCSHDDAMEEIARQSGHQFGPRPAGALLTLPAELFRRVQRADPCLPAGAPRLRRGSEAGTGSASGRRSNPQRRRFRAT